MPDDVPHPKISRPLNYFKIIYVTTSVLGVITFVYVAAPYVLPFLQNRNVWAAVSLFTIILFCSGHMFNHIRASPYVGNDGKGGISYIAGGFQNQYGLESQIVAALCKLNISHSKMIYLLQDRCCIDARHNFSRPQGPTYEGSQISANSSHRLGSGHGRDIQLPHEHLQSEEWRLPILASTFLSV